MSKKSILHSEIPFRGSETVQLDISLSLKNWFIHKLIILSPFMLLILGISVFKLFQLINLMSNDLDITNFHFFDKYFYISIVVGIVLTIAIGIPLGKKWKKAITEADELITSDEYIRGSKLVCVDDFNEQFKNEDDFLQFEIIEDKCERNF